MLERNTDDSRSHVILPSGLGREVHADTDRLKLGLGRIDHSLTGGQEPVFKRANAAVEGLLAASLGLPAECVRVVAGLSSARKTVAIERLSATQVGERLGKP